MTLNFIDFAKSVDNNKFNNVFTGHSTPEIRLKSENKDFYKDPFSYLSWQ